MSSVAGPSHRSRVARFRPRGERREFVRGRLVAGMVQSEGEQVVDRSGDLQRRNKLPAVGVENLTGNAQLAAAGVRLQTSL